jgi:hypothetical protein
MAKVASQVPFFLPLGGTVLSQSLLEVEKNKKSKKSCQSCQKVFLKELN